MATVIGMWRVASRLPGGRRLFTKAVQRRAPYFRTIPATVVEARPGLARVAMRKKRRVENHLGTVHAIATCNLLELAMGVCAEVSIPPDLRWIPKGMDVEYVGPARTDLVGTARVDDPWAPGDLAVHVEASDVAGVVVVRGTIRLWISERGTGERAQSSSGGQTSR